MECIALVSRRELDLTLFAFFAFRAYHILDVVIIAFPIEKEIFTFVTFESYRSSSFVIFFLTRTITNGATQRTCIRTRMKKNISKTLVAWFTKKRSLSPRFIRFRFQTGTITKESGGFHYRPVMSIPSFSGVVHNREFILTTFGIRWSKYG